jgi:asparaginyl-tRNA synthetase
MMQHSFRELAGGAVPPGTDLVLEGWVRTRRDSKAGLSFIHLSDGSTVDPLQVVAPANLDNYETEVLRITSGCALRVEGTLEESQGKGQSLEVQARRIEVVGWVDDPDTYPMQPKRHTMEFLREVAHLRPRTNIIGAVTRVRHVLAQAIHNFFDTRGFAWIHTPIISASDCEGAGELFRVSTLDLVNTPRRDDGSIDFDQDFFGREAFLAVSGQLNVEAYALAMNRVYTFGPTFRAENSNTRRHLAEFWMVEPEIAFADLGDDVRLAEDFLKSIFTAVLERCDQEMRFFARFVDRDCIERVEKLVSAEFETMTYSDAIDELERANRTFEFPVRWGADLQSEHERYLSEEVVGRPLAVIDYPKEIKAFYMYLNDDERTVAAVDVLAPGIGEIIGGSQREHRLEVLDRRIEAMGLEPEPYWWYRDLRRYGTVPHAGFGLGFERAIQYLTGVDNIRDVIPFPRAPRQADF